MGYCTSGGKLVPGNTQASCIGGGGNWVGGSAGPGNAGSPGNAGNPGTPSTSNCVPVVVGCFPVVASPTGPITVSWNTQ